MTNISWHISCHFLMFSGILSRSATSYSLFQCGPTTGQRTVYGPTQQYHWAADAFRKNIQIWNMLKCVWGLCQKHDETFASLNCLRWVKCICTRTMNNTFSLYHYCFCLFIYFTIKLEGTPSANSRWNTLLDNLSVFLCPGFRCLEEYIWRNELSTAK